MSKLVCAACALSLATLAPVARAAADADLTEIRKQIQSLKDDYEARIRALEDKLKDAEAKAAAPAPAPSAASANMGLAAFNPAVSLVLQGRYANLSQDPNTFAIAGFPLGGEAGPGRRGFSLSETEMTLSANADDRFAGQATISITPDNQVSVEEAFATYTAAPYGLAPKFGRFFSGIGYLNEQHQHAWDFVDAPLAYQAFLGGQYRNDGLQVKWIAPIEQYFEIGGEAGSGEAFPGSDRNKNGIGSGALYAHTGGDVGDSHSWRAGVSWLNTKSDERRAKDDTGIVDFVWKWAPNGNARQTSFKVQGEYFRRKEKGETAMDSPVVVDPASYSLTQSGWYLQAVYQPIPLWRVGVRYDSLDPGAADPFNPRKWTAMVDWSPSEFSRVRLQFARSQTVAEVTDNQVFVQYILSLGAHGAHKY
ncbi:MAG TPA: hypothetical protein VHP62_10000 [Usitatibacter sp.]|nr:hypothetical protein [Usitatibacter sp.]